MKPILFAIISLLFSPAALSTTNVLMYLVDAKGLAEPIGQIEITESNYGLVFAPALTKLTPGLHGFHLHQMPSCNPMEKDGKMTPALAAGSHFDPQLSNKHDFPWADGHLGDLPALYVDV